VVALVIVAALYVATARAGLLLEPVGGFATFVWAPTGIAIASALLLGGGMYVWATIFVAAFVTNLLTGAPVATAAGIGVGNMLEAVVAVWILRRTGFEVAFDRLRDAYLFMLAAAIAPIVSATLGVASLVLGGVLPSSQAWLAWEAWWTGDFIGALIVAPLVLSWTAAQRRGFTGRDVAEFAAMLLTLAFVLALVFFGRGDMTFLQAYLAFPVLLWASVRFEQRGATMAVLLTAIIAIAGTVGQAGPFARPDLTLGLLELQAFMGITAATFLVLATALAERTQSEAALMQANKAKSEFLATMSHELRTPLNAIGGYAELLEMGVHGELTPAQREPIERIRRSERRLRSLIDDVLNFARIEAGRIDVVPGIVRVNDAILEAETILTPQLKARQLRFSCECGTDVVAWADAEKVQQILLNLLANAVKFTPDRGSISCSCASFDEHVEIRVQDTGVGIPADRRDVIFDPFVQLGRSLASPQEGSGLGLSISRDLARAMNGDLSVRSEPGQGSIFTLSLPTSPSQ
jgi:signal transduction histidine kinase